MKKYLFVATLSIVSFFSCEKQNLDEPLDAVTENSQSDDLESDLLSTSNTYITTDITGTIEIYKSSVHTAGSSWSQDPNDLTVTSNVPAGFLCIGGTATMIINGNDAGSLLTESGPLTGSAEFTGWKVRAKAHHSENEHNWYLQSQAIGIRLKDNNGNYIPANVLKQYVKIFSSTSSSAPHPYKRTDVTSDYHLISGGAKVNWSGYGNLLTASYPSGTGWIARGKDHMYPSPATITSYAIGIKKTIPNFGSLSVSTGSNCENTSGFAQEVVLTRNDPNNTSVITGFGALALYNNDGRMLTRMVGSNHSVVVNSKDHEILDTGATCAYYIALRKN